SGKTIGPSSYVTLVLTVPSSHGNFSGLYITKVSVVEGDARSEDDPYSPRHVQQELAMCQRYYQQIRTTGNWFPTTTAYGDLNLRHFFTLPTSMRGWPTVTKVGGSGSLFYGGGWQDASVTAQGISESLIQVV